MQKKKYEKPELKNHGNLKNITLGGALSGPDSAGGVDQAPELGDT